MENGIEGRQRLMESVSDNAISLLRLNVFIVGVYISVVAITLQSGQDIANVLNSFYTYVGIISWSGSTVLGAYCYFASTTTNFQISTGQHETSDSEENEHPVISHENGTILLLHWASILGILMTLFSFAFGYYDGFIQGGLPVQKPIEIIATGTLFLLLTVIYTLGGIIIIFLMYDKSNEIFGSMKEIEKEEFKQIALSQYEDLRNRPSEDD